LVPQKNRSAPSSIHRQKPLPRPTPTATFPTPLLDDTWNRRLAALPGLPCVLDVKNVELSPAAARAVTAYHVSVFRGALVRRLPGPGVMRVGEGNRRAYQESIAVRWGKKPGMAWNKCPWKHARLKSTSGDPYLGCAISPESKSHVGFGGGGYKFPTMPLRGRGESLQQPLSPCEARSSPRWQYHRSSSGLLPDMPCGGHRGGAP
jgi:hypothetical protein